MSWVRIPPCAPWGLSSAGERLFCKQDVVGSNPTGSTTIEKNNESANQPPPRRRPAPRQRSALGERRPDGRLQLHARREGAPGLEKARAPGRAPHGTQEPQRRVRSHRVATHAGGQLRGAHGAVAQFRESASFATTRSRVRIPSAPPTMNDNAGGATARSWGTSSLGRALRWQ